MLPSRSKTGPVRSQVSSCNHQHTPKLCLLSSSCSTDLPDNHYRANHEPVFPKALSGLCLELWGFRRLRENQTEWYGWITYVKKPPFQLTILCVFFLKPKTIFKNFSLTKNLVGKTCYQLIRNARLVCTHTGPGSKLTPHTGDGCT